MLLRQVAIISESDNVSAAEVSVAAAAIQKQVTRDFGPIWEIDATVDSFSALEDVPIDYWPIIISDEIDEPGAGGVRPESSTNWDNSLARSSLSSPSSRIPSASVLMLARMTG